MLLAPPQAARAVNLYTLDREIALGKQLSAEVERQAKLADDPILSEYVNRVAQNIARQSDATLPVTVRIIESGDLNAFTLPGGHIYLNSALLKLTESEAELAFILAHEIGHVAARHATREASRDELLRAGSLPLWILGGWSGVAVRGSIIWTGRDMIRKRRSTFLNGSKGPSETYPDV
jgi:predicted Zn-dependent protease